MANTLLVIGNQNYSSWSFRAWLALKMANIPFETKKIDLYKADSKSQIKAYSPSGKVPVLNQGGIVIWDSLAIGLHLANQYPHLLPATTSNRAKALSVICEMHAGFQVMRKTITMDMTRKKSYTSGVALEADINRIQEIWTGLRNDNKNQGPFLFGQYSLADAVFAPVVSRFFTYGVPVKDVCSMYMQAVSQERFYQEWLLDAQNETEIIDWSKLPV